MATLDDYYAAQKQRDGARREIEAIADSLSTLADTLRDDRGIRLAEKTGATEPHPHHVPVYQDDLVTWGRLEPAIRAFTRADDAFRRINADLTPEQRGQLGH
jgi:hypothetical protein